MAVKAAIYMAAYPQLRMSHALWDFAARKLWNIIVTLKGAHKFILHISST
jgi:hypothetical protein